MPGAWRRSAEFGIVVASYFLAHYVMTGFLVNDDYVVIFPTAGVALAAMLLFGRSVWVAVATGAVASGLAYGLPPPLAISMSAAVTIPAWLGAYLISEVGKITPDSPKYRQAAAFFLLGAVPGSFLFASLLTVHHYFANTILNNPLPVFMGDVFLAHLLGTLAVVPAAMVATRLAMTRRKIRLSVNMLVLAALSAAWCWFLYRPGEVESSAVILTLFLAPTVCWALLWFYRPGVGVVLSVLILGGAYGVAHQTGPFAGMNPHEAFLVFAALTLALSFSVMFFAAVLDDRSQELEDKVYQRELLATAFNGNEQSLLLLGPDNSIEMANKSFLNNFGFSEENVRGKDPCFIYATSEEAKQYGKEFSDTDLGKTIVFCRRATGSVFPAVVLQHLVRGSPDQPSSTLLSVQDVTERLLTQRLRLGQSKFLQAVIDGWHLDVTMDILTVTAEVVRPGMFASVLLQDESGSRLLTCSAPSLPSAYCEAIDGLEIGPLQGACGASAYLGQRVVCSNLSTDPNWEGYRELAAEAGLASCWSEPIVDSGGEILGSFALYYSAPSSPDPQDIGLIEDFAHYAAIAIEKKKSERALHQAKAEAEIASNAKSDFLANMSHELRTPLNAIIGFSEMLENQVFGPIENSTYLGYVADIRKSGKNLLAIINQMLVLSKIEAGNFEIQHDDVNIRDTLVSVMKEMYEDAKKKNLQLSNSYLTTLDYISGDQQAVRRILQNLLSNAIKYTPQGGKVIVENFLKQDGSMVIVFKDNGIGISAEMISEVQEPFAQVDPTKSSRFGGAGLGLAVTKSLLELHGGRLEIESTLGVGTTIYAIFPPYRIIHRNTGMLPKLVSNKIH